MTTELYERTMKFADAEEDSRRGELMRKVWEQTPWMVDAYTGSHDDPRYMELMQWCRDEFGSEAWPIHGHAGNWHSGGATIDGWTWLGFATKEQMQQFIERWPEPHNA